MDTERTPRSVNFDVDNLAWMDGNIGNRSDFVNELIRSYRQGESSIDAAIARFRREQIQSELQHLQQRQESLKDELERYRQAEESASTEYQDDIGRLLEKLEHGVRVWPDHGMVVEIAAKHSRHEREVIRDLVNSAESSGVQTETVEQ